MNTKVKVAGALAGVLALAAAIAIAVAILSVTSSPRAANAPARITVAPLTAARAFQMDTELRSGQQTQVAKAVVMPAGTAPTPSALRALAGLKSVSFDAKSFRQLTPTLATVTATVVDGAGAARTWQATLTLSGGEWKLAQTLQGS